MYDEPLYWEAIYKNHSVVCQYSSIGPLSTEQLDRRNLRIFRLINSDNNKINFTINFNAGDKFIFRRKVRLRPDLNVRHFVYIVGKVDVHENLTIHAIDRNRGCFMITDKWQEDFPFDYDDSVKSDNILIT